ncbi:MAG TPA: 50S ribosomal protein L29 [Burkholderiales bacterium]|jgi:large subunit ribosomal protein L29|nr:50S ribosomal protein L29 [Burkholderiales bacterium]
MSKRKEALARVRDLPDDELGQAHTRAREELFRLKLGNYTNQVENTVSVRHKRRELARIITIQRARELTLEAQAEGGGSATETPAPKAKAKAEKKPAAPKKKAKPEKSAKAPAKAKKSGKEG